MGAWLCEERERKWVCFSLSLCMCYMLYMFMSILFYSFLSFPLLWHSIETAVENNVEERGKERRTSSSIGSFSSL